MAERRPPPDPLRDALARLLARDHGDLRPEDVADVLWISRLAGLAPLPRERDPDGSRPRLPDGADGCDPTADRDPGVPGGGPADPPTAGGPPEPRVRLYGLPAPGPGDPGRAHVVQVPRPPALTGVLDLSRALRPLRRWAVSTGPPELDEEATAQATGGAGRLIPVWTPAREPHFSVDLLVDTGATMAVWHDLASELYTALQVHGAFADVRCWALDTDRAVPRLAPFRRRYRTGVSGHGPSAAWQRPLADRFGRRILLVLTDGVGPAWYGDPLPDLLARTSRTRPTAALQVLPRRLWHRTALHTAPVEARASHPDRPGTAFRTEAALPGIPRGPRGSAERAAVSWLPVMEVDGTWLAPWAGSVAGRTSGWAPMLAAPLRGVRRPLLPPRDPGAPPSAADRVARFLSGASPRAFRLACHLAAAPLSLPVMRWVQQATVPGSGQQDLAEIFLSGLIERRDDPARPADPDEVVYDFARGVREELLAELTRGESLRVLDRVVARVSGRIAATFGGTLDFRALGAMLDEGGSTATGRPLPERSLPFAEVAVAVLRGAGGEHRTVLRRLEAAVGAGRRAAAGPPATPVRPSPVRRERLTPVRPVESPPDLPVMIGRKEELAALTRAVAASLGTSAASGVSSADGPGPGPAFVVVEGMAGMGRNRLVQEYLRRDGERHSFVHWINARRTDSLQDGLLRLWQALAPVGAPVGELPPLERLWETLAEHRDWLIVLDGVSHWPPGYRPDLPAPPSGPPYGFPTGGRGCVLATTDVLRWTHPRLTGIRLGRLTVQENLDFLHTVLGAGLDPLDARQRDGLERLAERMPLVPDRLTWSEVEAGLAHVARWSGRTEEAAERRPAPEAPAPRTGGPPLIKVARPYFFLSYAHSPRFGHGGPDPDLWVSRFFRDLSDHVTALTDLPNGSPPGFMDQEVRTGEVWSDRVAEALATCRVFVPLYSPRYFTSEFCGREWFAFAQRAAYHRARTSMEGEGIVPAQWVPVPPAQLPDVAVRLQSDFGSLGERYATDGLYGLIKLRSYAEQYEQAVYELAKRVVRVGNTSDIAAGRPADYRSSPSAFGTAGRPRGVLRIAVAAPAASTLPAGRDARHHGDGPDDWNPFHPESATPLALVAAELANRLNNWVVHSTLDAEVARVRDGSASAGPLLLLVDRWAFEVPALREGLLALDAAARPGTGAVVVWNQGDREERGGGGTLSLSIPRMIPHLMRGNPPADRGGTRGLENFGRAMSSVTEAIFQEYLRTVPVHAPAEGTSASRPRLGPPLPDRPPPSSGPAAPDG
ncbi:TIR-like protein FxsC [Streptomyces sp. NPDC058674]|uniref:TIR-like protein FxsC n=1 Tax=Streptomyces sp. NPDC058674 TaxID=3346592 RepID=UPI00366A2601